MEIDVGTVTKWVMAALLLMIFVIPQSFMYLKLPFLGVVLISFVRGGIKGEWTVRSREAILYYLVFSILTIVWCMIGLLRGNPPIAVVEAVRVYLVYMWLYFAVMIYISNLAYQESVDKLVALGAVGIAGFALYAVANQVLSLGWLPEWVEEEMYLQVGLHPGYVQLNNVNIGMLTFILPYLVSRVLLEEKRSAWLFVGFAVAVLSAILASRRAVMLLVFIAPAVACAIAAAAGKLSPLHRRRAAVFYAWSMLLAAFSSWLFMKWGGDHFDSFATRLLDAFAADRDDPRPLQHASLVDAFVERYVWGSGFGGLTSVVRADDRPWTYELTYSRLLFNSGLVGISSLIVFFASYLYLAIRKIRKLARAPVYISLLVGFLSVLIAAASNPYLSSFDFVFCLSVIPLILNTRDFERTPTFLRGGAV